MNILKRKLNKIKRKLNKKIYNFSIRKALKPHYQTINLKAEGYHSQHGQDKFIYENFYKDKKDGFFVDIGANDGVHFSNTLTLENKFDWNGVAIEPLPETFEKLRLNRTCKTVNACVGTMNKEVEFLAIEGESEMLSGIIDNYDKQHIKRIEKAKRKGAKATTIKVPAYTLDHVMEDAPNQKIDYINIDTEGGEFEILQSIDFKKYKIDTISVENNYHDRRFANFMKAAGYQLVALIGDEIYRRQKA
tara:strand:- start:1442 stop:2182 length:741 start_codon:yes stop_codon:yes gene_type:complete